MKKTSGKRNNPKLIYQRHNKHWCLLGKAFTREQEKMIEEYAKENDIEVWSTF